MDSYKDKADSFLGNSDSEFKSSIRNMAVGLTPTLLSFLGNRSAQMKNRAFQKADKFTEGLADEKGVEVIGEDGNPTIIPEGEAMFRRPYHKPEKSSLADPSNVFAVKDMFNKVSQKPETIMFLKDGRAVKKIAGQGFIEVSTDDYEKDYGVGTASSSNQFDEKRIEQYKKNAPNLKKTVAADTSSARQSGFGSKKEEDEAYRSMEDTKKAQAKFSTDYETAKSAYKKLATRGTDMSSEEVAATLQSIIRPLNVDRMSDADFVRMKGDDYKSIVRKFDEFMAGNFQGKMTPQMVESFKTVATDAMKSIKEKSESFGKSMLPKGSYGKKAEKFIGTKMGKESPKEDDFTSFRDSLKTR